MRSVAATGFRRFVSLEWSALGVLILFTVMTLAGYASFGLHPELLARYPDSVAFYTVAFDFFAQAQVWLAFGVLALFLVLRVGARWLGAFAAVYLVSLGSELLGTTVGLPFGEYHYTSALGPKWFAHVPVVIPLSWFFMALPSYALARAWLPGASRRTARIFFASLLLLGWDLILDPAMSHATAYWVWAEPGTYYGMPWLNLFGWYVTGLALMGCLSALRADGWIASLPLGWLATFYAVNLFLPLGMSAAAGLWGAVAATLLAAGGAVLVGRHLAGRESTTSREPVGVSA